MSLRKIDALVSEHVMEEPVEWYNGHLLSSYNGYNHTEIPYYSTDFPAAWGVMETLRSMDDKKYQLIDFRWREGWEVGYFKPPKQGFLLSHHEDIRVAICLAALKCKGIDYES